MSIGSSSSWRDFKFPGYDPFEGAEDFDFDESAGQHAIDFFHEALTHVKGDLAGTPFKLELWQQAFIGFLFGWKRKDGTRRYREVYYSTGRKNGKTSIASGLVIFVLLCDGEPGCEAYLAAADRSQAGISYDIMTKMIRNKPELLKQCEIYRNHVKSRDGFARAISADAPTKLGFNSHLVVIDELMAQPKRDLVDILTTSTGARRQPLVVYLTTAGHDQTSICYEKYTYAKQVCNGEVKDPSFFPVIYEAEDPGDLNWSKKETWALANPNMNISISEDYLARECDKAMDSPFYENTFKTLHLNMWVESTSRFISLSDWDQCPIGTYDLRDNEAYIGVDMASKEDVAALNLVFPPTIDRPVFVVLGKYFIPKEAMIERSKRHKVPYFHWEREGRVIATPGPTIDPERMFQQIQEWCSDYVVRELVYDPHGIEWLLNKFESEYTDIPTVMVTGTPTKIHGPMMTLYDFVRQHKIDFQGCPVLRWMAANVAVEFTKEGLVKPIRPQNHLKIDGIISTAISLSRAALAEFSDTVSVYDERTRELQRCQAELQELLENIKGQGWKRSAEQQIKIDELNREIAEKKSNFVIAF